MLRFWYKSHILELQSYCGLFEKLELEVEDQAVVGDISSVNIVREEDEEYFRICCEDDLVWK